VPEPRPGPRDSWLREIWECASDAIALSDPEGIVLAANPAYYRLYGFEPADVLGRSFAIIFPDDQRALAEEQYREVFASDLAPPILQSTVRRQDGRERVVETRVSFIEEANRRTAMLSIVRDVTDEVNARRDAARAEHDLRELLFSLSHDIKNPLAVIKGHAQVLRRHVVQRLAAPPLDRLKSGLAQIEASATRLDGLADELVELAALPGGSPLPLHLASVDLVALAREAVDRHQRLTDEHQLSLDQAVESLRGRWDGPRLVRVLDNLLANAIKYSPAGGPINVRVAAEGSRALVAVEDRGIGIDAADLPHVFDRFHRGANVPDMVVGSGIGLTSVRQIVEQHGGDVHIVSSPGAGTSVTAWLPLEEEAAHAARQAGT
jgi:PAS domain S-box-containing protein